MRLGITGKADVVEFPLHGDDAPLLVEYKRGKPKADLCDEVQLCAQALCLEEMLATAVPAGALYYGTPRRRTEVTFTPELRAETERLAARMHELYVAARTPLAIYEKKKCGNCSLVELCQPKLQVSPNRASRYFREALAGHLAEPAPE